MNNYYELIKELEDHLNTIMLNDLNEKERFIKCLLLSTKYFTNFKYVFLSDSNINTEKEIDFFRNIKPRVLSKIIYYRHLCKNQDQIQLIHNDKLKDFYIEQLADLKHFLVDHQAFENYLNSQNKSIQQVHFLRASENQPLMTIIDFLELDGSFTTQFDVLKSVILAYKDLVLFYEQKLEDLFAPSTRIISHYKWTGSKTELTELVYALHSASCINNGDASINEIASLFTAGNQIESQELYRNYSHIKNRATSHSKFLNKLAKCFEDQLQEDL